MFHCGRWTVCAQIEFGFNCIVPFIIYLLHRFCLQVYGAWKHTFALIPSVRLFFFFSTSFDLCVLYVCARVLTCVRACVCVGGWDVLVRSFFIPYYSRIKDTVILLECGVHYRSSLPSRVNVFNKRDCLFSQYTLKRQKIANVSSVMPVCSIAHCSNHLDHLDR